MFSPNCPLSQHRNEGDFEGSPPVPFSLEAPCMMAFFTPHQTFRQACSRGPSTHHRAIPAMGLFIKRLYSSTVQEYRSTGPQEDDM